MLTEAQIRLALCDCYDPEFRLNIVELGRVEEIGLRVDHDAPGAGISGVPDRYALDVALLRAEHNEAADGVLAALVYNRLAGMPELSRVNVRFANAPGWTPARITSAGRRKIGLDQPQFPILNNRVR